MIDVGGYHQSMSSTHCLRPHAPSLFLGGDDTGTLEASPGCSTRVRPRGVSPDAVGGLTPTGV